MYYHSTTYYFNVSSEFGGIVRLVYINFSMRAIVIGGSIAGKSSAAFLSRLSASNRSLLFSEIIVIEQSQSEFRAFQSFTYFDFFYFLRLLLSYDLVASLISQMAESKIKFVLTLDCGQTL